MLRRNKYSISSNMSYIRPKLEPPTLNRTRASSPAANPRVNSNPLNTP